MRALVTHLRLHFQLLLAPVFLWGWLLAGGSLTWAVVLAFASFHLFLYSGATAFNSYYDRDTGPVGGLERPPAVDEALLPFSLGVQAIGALLAAWVNLSFFVIYAIFFVLSVAYSHPRIRLKAHPWGSILVVAFGQGVLAFSGAWAAAQSGIQGLASFAGVLGASSAALLILALYPISQLYQVDEDTARGDRTVAAIWGARRCFQFAVAATLLGGAAMLTVIARLFGAVDTVIVALGLAVQIRLLLAWSREVDTADVLGTYRRVMRLNTLSASTLSAYFLARLVLELR